jgi:hypothetical protein
VVYHQNIRHVEIHKYVNVNRVVVVNKDRLYGVHRRYETTRDVTVVKNIVNNGRAAPVVTREVVQGADLKKEHHFARSGDFSRKPNVDATSEFAGRRRGSGGGTETAQALAPGIQKANLKTSEGTGQPALAKPGDENKRNLPETPRELRREQRQEKRLEANKERSTKEASGPPQLQHQQKQQQVAERQQQQQVHQDAQQRRQQQQLAHQQQQAQRQQLQLQRQQEQQAQRQQQQQQQQLQRQKQLQADQQQQAQRQQQQQQAQQRQSQKQAHRQQQQQP